MIRYKTKEEIEIMRHSCRLVGMAQAEIAKVLKPGITTKYLNKIAEEFITDNGGYPTFKNYHGYPYATCISVNDMIVHGFPNDNELKDGDIVSVDIGIFKNGFHGDSAYTFAIGEISNEIKQL